MSDDESRESGSEFDGDEVGEDEGELVEFEFTCDSCGEGIFTTETRFHCDECGDFDLCETCFFDEESEVSHEHKLREVKEGRVLFAHEDKRTGNILYLGDFRAALPSSMIVKNHNIKAVLSAVDFDPKGNLNKELDQLQAIYQLHNKKTIPVTTTLRVQQPETKTCVVYHHFNMPDLQKPQLLFDYKLSQVLEEATSFMDVAMSRGNLLVHCERGQFRSPTLILAWLITRGMTVDDAIAHIDDGYLNDGKKDRWGKKYQNSRPEWVARLKKWQANHKKDRQEWLQDSHTKVQKWKELWGGAAPVAPILHDNEPPVVTDKKRKESGKSDKSGGADSGDEKPVTKKVKSVSGR